MISLSSWSHSPSGPLRLSLTPGVDSGIALSYIWTLLSQTCEWSFPAGHWLAAFVGIHHHPLSIVCWHSRMQACNMANRDKRRWCKMSQMVDKLDRWSTSALETWVHQRISSICRWHIMWKAYGVFIWSIFLYLRAERTLSMLGTGVLWCWYWQNCNSISSVENSSSPILRSTSGQQ